MQFCGFVLFKYRKETEKTAIIILIEKLLISLSDLLALLNVLICCEIEMITTNNDPIEEGKKLLNLIRISGKTLNKLKELAANENKDAENLLKNIKSDGQTMINNININ